MGRSESQVMEVFIYFSVQRSLGFVFSEGARERSVSRILSPSVWKWVIGTHQSRGWRNCENERCGNSANIEQEWTAPERDYWWRAEGRRKESIFPALETWMEGGSKLNKSRGKTGLTVGGPKVGGAGGELKEAIWNIGPDSLLLCTLREHGTVNQLYPNKSSSHRIKCTAGHLQKLNEMLRGCTLKSPGS